MSATMTTTLMEPFDAHMMDYPNDHDVQMHVTTSDSWFQDEAPMEDDGNLAFQPKSPSSHTTHSVEVDMETEAYGEGDHIEYEMIDDDHHNTVQGEILDVDLLDVSAVQSPYISVTPLPFTPAVEYPQTQFSLQGPQVASTPSFSLPVPVEHHVPPEDTHSSFEHSHEQSQPNVTNHESNTEGPQLPVVSSGKEVVVHSHHSSRHSSVPAQPVANNQGFSTEVREEAIVDATTGDMYQGVSYHHDPTLDPTPADSFTYSGEIEASRVDEHAHPDPSIGVQVVEENPVGTEHHDDATTDGPPAQGSPENPLSVDESAVNGVTGPTLYQEQPHIDEQHVKHVDTDASITQHEVPDEDSEEVYLDAPPPILLSIFSTDHPELCLFNKPTEPLPTEDDSQEQHILLQQNPNLYYESLVNVFEYLRQDEYVSTVLEIVGTELAINAYDLDLTVTEDNTYARDISLHDFQLLHTSAGIEGPLRLRLHIAGPRFIVRYHMLREGLINLHVDDSDDSESHHGEEEEMEDDQSEHDHYEHTETEEITATEQTHTDATETAPGAEEHEYEDDHTEEHTELEPELGLGEENVEETGEIDLSTLPPFIDSPEAEHEQTEQDDAEPEDYLPPIESALTSDSTSLDQHNDQQPVDAENKGNVDHLDVSSTVQGLPEEQTEENDTEHLDFVEQEHIEGTEIDTFELTESADNDTQQAEAVEQNDVDDQEHFVEDSAHAETTPRPEETTITNQEASPTEPANTDNNKYEENQDIFREEPTEDQSHNLHDDSHPSVEAIGLFEDGSIEELKDFDEEPWDDELDGEGDLDTTWEAEQDAGDETNSNESSVTLSSKASKRSFDEYGLENEGEPDFISQSPDSKRARVD